MFKRTPVQKRIESLRVVGNFIFIQLQAAVRLKLPRSSKCVYGWHYLHLVHVSFMRPFTLPLCDCRPSSVSHMLVLTVVFMIFFALRALQSFVQLWIWISDQCCRRWYTKKQLHGRKLLHDPYTWDVQDLRMMCIKSERMCVNAEVGGRRLLCSLNRRPVCVVGSTGDQCVWYNGTDGVFNNDSYQQIIWNKRIPLL